MYSDQSPVYDQQQQQQQYILSLQQMQHLTQQQQQQHQQQMQHDPNMQSMNGMDINMNHPHGGDFNQQLQLQQQMLNAQQQAYYTQQMGNVDPSAMTNARNANNSTTKGSKGNSKKKTSSSKSKENKNAAAKKAKAAKASAAAKAKVKKQKELAKVKNEKMKNLEKEKKKKVLDKEKKKKEREKLKVKKDKEREKVKKDKDKAKLKLKAKKDREAKIALKKKKEKEKQEKAAADGKKRKRLMKKNPDAPKRGKSAYILYSIERRDIVKEALGEDAKVQEIMKKVALDWRNLPEEEKKPWEDKSLEDKARYERELASYEGPLKIPNRRPKRAAGAPKRGMSAFLMFSQVMRPKLRDEMPDKKNIDISKMLGEKWKELPEDEKLPWVQKADEDAIRYKEEKTKWDEYDPEERKAISDKAMEEEREKQRQKEEEKAKEKAASQANDDGI